MLQTYFQNIPTACQNETLHLNAEKMTAWESESTTQIKKEILYTDIQTYRIKKMKVGDISVDAGWLQRDSREDFTDMNTFHKYNY